MTVLRDIKARKLYFAVQGRFVKSQNPEYAMRWMQETMKPETSVLQFLTGGDAPVAIATKGRGGIHSHQGSPAWPGAAYCQLVLGQAMFAERVDGASLLFLLRLPVTVLSRERVAGCGGLLPADCTNESRIWPNR